MASNFHIAEAKVHANGKDRSIGRGIFASCRIQPGDQITVLKRPLVGSLESHRLPDTCANCYVWTEGSSSGTRLYVDENTKVQKCAGCQRFRYCSKTCQKEAWNRGHKHECKSLRPMVGREIPKAVLACMEILSRRKHGHIADEEWDLLLQLQTHIDDFKANGSYSNIELMAMAASQFSATQNMFNKDFVAAMYARVLSNSLTLITPTLDPLGIVLDPTLGTLNHSCDPNAFLMMDGPHISLRALKTIQKDEEIFISYIDNTYPYRRRQSELQARWFFTCHCSKCQMGASSDEDEWLGSSEEMPKAYQSMADDLLSNANSAQGASNDIGDSTIDQRLAALQEYFLEHYEEIQSLPTEKAIAAIENAMDLCHKTDIWPLYHQPYAAFRDDFIINLLTAGRFTDAWAHCATRYKHILPKLYPEPFHPVRVVQTWQMAMLAAYLASTPGSVDAPGVNMGLIAMMLVKQVLDVASLSHGADSSFTKSVRGKAEEMVEELKRSLGGSVDSNIMNKELEAQRDMLVVMGDWAKF